MIDKRIVQAFKLRGQVERLWKKLLQPIRIGKDPDTWLVLSPERVRVTPIRTQNGALTIALAAAVRARAIVGDATPTSKTAAELPPPEMLDVASNTFEASVPVTLSYGEAARLAMERLKKKPLQAAGMKLGIDKLVILPSGQDLIVQAHFCLGRKWDFTHLLDSCGDIYLRGVPKFDAANDKIEIANLHYDIASQNLMLRIMRALSGDALGKALQPHLVFDESREIEKLKRNIATALAKPQGRGVTLSGRITSFGQPKLTWTKDGFLALFSAKGTIAAALNMKQPG